MNRSLLRLDLLIASAFINLLGLAVPLYVIQAFSRYISSGFNETLYALTLGVLVAILFELLFKHYRLRALSELNATDKVTNEFFSRANDVNFAEPVIRNIENLHGHINKIKDRDLSKNLKVQLLCLDLPFSFIYVFVVYLVLPVASLIFFLAVIPAILFGIILGKKAQRLNVEKAELKAESELAQKEIVSHFGVLSLFGLLPERYANWREKELKFRAILVYSQANVFSSQNFQAAFLLLAVSLTVFASAIEIYEGNLDAGALLALNILISRAFRPIAAIPEIATALAPRKRFREFFEMSARAPKRKGSRIPKGFGGNIELRSLSLRYPNNHVPVYENFSFTFEAGSTTVVTGSNGSGKTSLFNMLIGSTTPTAGSILIDDLNLEQIQMDWWRNQIIPVEQEPKFLHDTLRNNLLGSRQLITDEDLALALSASGLTTFVDQSADGLETKIGFASTTFNLGFRKRLALARASISTGGLVIMDEPTEGLDAPGAQIFYSFLNQQIAEKKTVIVLTHDPAIIKGADDIIDLDKAKSATR